MPTVALVGPELFPIPPIRGGATEQFIEQLAHRLQGWRPVVIGRGDPELALREVRGQVQYRRVPLSGWRRWLYARHRGRFPFYDRGVADIIREVKPDLVHVHNRPLLALYLKEHLPQIPLILHMHNLYTILGKREKPAPGTPIPVEAFIACSRFVLEQERNRLGSGAQSHVVMYNGVDLESFKPGWEQEARVAELRRRYQVTDEPTVLFVGKLRESKGVGVLLAAMELVWRQIPRAVLILVGGTEFGRGRTDRQTSFLQHVQNLSAQARGRVILTGFIPPQEIAQAYALGDVFVGPSQNEEGLGMVFLEAAACGLPVIATRLGGIPEAVCDGVNGLLLERQDDLGELAEKILLLLSDEGMRQRFGRQGREWVSQHFSWQEVAQQQEDVYNAVIGRRARQ
jgi:spore coat protein SA